MLTLDIEKQLNQFNLKVKFEAKEGITGIIGPSGSGKSVTLQCIAGLQAPDTGEITLNNKLLFHAARRINQKSRHREVGYVFQQYALFPHLTVAQNIAYGLFGESKQSTKEKVANMLHKMQLNGYENHFPHQISGGQQQRVALARTLITEPKLLLLDEPFSALDQHLKAHLEQELLQIINENYSGIVLLVTHNMEEAYRLCDYLVLLNQGKLIQYGKKEEVFRKPKNITAAKIVGSQNILPISSTTYNEQHFECYIEGVRLHIRNEEREMDPVYVGIHAEDVLLVDGNHVGGNIFNYDIKDIITGIHQSYITVELEHKILIHMILPNSQLDQLLQKTKKICLPDNKLFLLYEDF